MWDLAVIGGGPAGASAALTAAAAGARVVLVHAASPDPHESTERLGPGGARWAMAAGALQDVPGPASGVLRECAGVRSRWGRGGDQEFRSIFQPMGGGWVVSRPRFDPWMRGLAAGRGAEVLAATVSNVTGGAGGWVVHLSEAGRTTEVRAGALLLAVGRSRRLLRCVGADIHTVTDELAILARLSPVVSGWVDDPLLLVESLPRGWTYGILETGARALVGVVGPPDSRILSAWRQALQASRLVRTAMGSGRVECVWAQPCSVAWAHRVAGPGWALSGDCACAHTPLSGQGMSFAMESGTRAARALLGGAAGARALDDYAAWVRSTAEGHARTLDLLRADLAA